MAGRSERRGRTRRGAVCGIVLFWVLLAFATPVLAADGDWRRIEPPSSPAPSRIDGVAWSGGTFVAVGRAGGDPRPAAWTSPDGSGWTRITEIDETGPGAMLDVAPAAPGFLAVGSLGDDGAVWAAEPDADAWRRVLVASFLGAEMHAVEDTWAGTIVVGFDTDTGSAGIWRRDGDAWTQVPDDPALAGVRLRGIETGSFDIIAVGEDVRDGSAAALISPDGITWTRLDELEVFEARLSDAHWGPFTVVGGFVDPTGQDPPRELISYDVSGGDSDEWRTAQVMFPKGAELTAVAFSGRGEIAVGHAPATSEAVVYENVGAQTWESPNVPADVFAGAGMTDVVRGGGASPDVLVAVGWSGSGAGDGADARAAIWTTAAGGSSSFESVVPGPFDISTDPVVIATGLAVATGTALLIPFPGALFNSTLEANGEEVASWFRGLRRRAAARRPGRRGAAPADASRGVWQGPLGIVAFLLISAVVYALLDPTLAVDLHSLWLVIGLLAGLVITSFVFAVPTAAYRWARRRERPTIQVMPWTILVAIGCVLLSRLTAFQPGYLYGLLIGFTFATELSVRDEGRATAIASAWVLALTVLAWFGLALVRGGGDPDGAVTTILTAALTTVVVAGFEGLVFGLLPLRFLPGAAIFAWSRRTWTVLFVVGFFGFLHVLVNPQSGYLADTARTPILTVVLLFVFFGAISVALWAYFRFRPARPTSAET